MTLHVQGIPTADYERLRCGGPDAHGEPPLLRISEGLSNPCRHCLGLINEGEPKLVLAYRPFAAPQPYAETGPIFLHQNQCARYDSEALPAWFAFLDPALVRGYGADDWIRYQTADVVHGRAPAGACSSILSDASVSYVHIRSKFGCFQCRVDRV